MVLTALTFAGLAVGLQRPIGEALMGRMARERAGRDVIANWPDGLHLAICGSGSPMPDPRRAGPCSVVVAGGDAFVVDVGEGGARNIGRMGLAAPRIRAVFLTHFHSDHLDSLGNLMLQRWVGAASPEPLAVYGPTGVDEVVAGFNAAYGPDARYRTAHHGARVAPPEGAGGRSRAFSLPPSGMLVVYQAKGLTVRAFAVDHDPVRPAVGYRFDYGGRSLVISGDTARSPAVVTAARGADLLVHEALQPALVAKLEAGLEARSQPRTAQIMRDIPDYHTTPQEAAEVAAAAGVGRLILNHVTPPIPFRYGYAAFLGDAPRRFAGPITVAEDGQLVSLPSGSKAITLRRLF